MYPELTIKGTIHYHIVFRLTDQVKWYKCANIWIQRNSGYVDIQKIKQYAQCMKYCQKSVDVMELVIGIFIPLRNNPDDYRDNKLITKRKTLAETYERQMSDAFKRMGIIEEF